MQAMVQDSYGSAEVIHLENIDRPEIADDEVLVRVQAASIHVGDWILMTGSPWVMRLATGLRRPKNRVPGTDVAGIVEAVGTNVKKLRPGDEVFGWGVGAFAEFARATEDQFIKKPANLTFEQASAVGVSATTALQLLRDDGKVQPGQKVLVNGASGGVGTFAVQIAKALGAYVTAVTSTRNLDVVRSIGPDEVIDYTQEDFTLRGQRHDVLFDVAATRSLADLRRVLEPNGTLVLAGAAKSDGFTPLARILKALVLSRVVSQRLVPYIATVCHDDLVVLKELIEAGKLSPVIDRTFPLSEAADAVRYVGTGQARAKVVINVS